MRRPLLLPLVPLYAAGLALREMRLERGWEPVRRLQWPVISVGNLSTGGSGKTPLTIALARMLVARGFYVDVLSRGYGRKTGEAARVRLDGDADEFGDEPLLIAREAGVPVFVASERFSAGQFAETEARMHSEECIAGAKAPFHDATPNVRAEARTLQNQVQIGVSQQPVKSCSGAKAPCAIRHLHLLDDGFQHRQLARDVDVLLINREDWHDHLLPAGNLRERLGAARRASVLAIPAEDRGFEPELSKWGWTGPIWRIRRRMNAPQLEGPAAAFCGIARPEQFFAGLEAAGVQLVLKKAFADHHRYTARDIENLIAGARAAGATALITTQKDEVRIGKLVERFPAEIPLRTARLDIAIDDEAGVMNWLEQRLACVQPDSPGTRQSAV